MRSKILQIVIGLLLAGAGLYIFFSGDDAAFETLAAEIADTSVFAVTLCAALSVLSIWFRAVRLAIMLPDNKPAPPLSHNHAENPAGADGSSADGPAREPNAAPAPPRRHKRGLFATTTVSFMINNILPARLGEAARVFLLWKRNGYPVTVGIGALLLERALDSAAYLLFLFVPVFFSPTIASGLRGAWPGAIAVIWLAAAAFAATVALFLLYALLPGAFRSAFGRLCALLPAKARARAAAVGAELESGLDWVSSPRKAAAVALLSLATALCYAAMLPALISDWGAFGFLEALFGQAFAAIGSAIPLAPGAVGTLHAVLLQGLTMMGVEPGKARAVAVVYHGLQYALITLLGLVMMVGLNIRVNLKSASDCVVKEPGRES